MIFDLISIERKRLRQLRERFVGRDLEKRLDFLSQLQVNHGATLMHEHNVELRALQFWKTPQEVRPGADFCSQLQLRTTLHANALHVEDRLPNNLADAERQWDLLTAGKPDDDNDDHWAAHYREALRHAEKVLNA